MSRSYQRPENALKRASGECKTVKGGREPCLRLASWGHEEVVVITVAICADAGRMPFGEVTNWTSEIHSHNHPTQPGKEQQGEMAAELKKKSKTDIFRPAAGNRFVDVKINVRLLYESFPPSEM
ncbi:hypothetical protein E2C01_050641 [Portunus trituberculatus]|uniref:Uncharacterized protein n=1 Tax=Portunus trituberculatus TaxID=210409 RepID=A0A5B7GGJ0_PORTR|nr:hypothetical protein [Portunus trituberculatus]